MGWIRIVPGATSLFKGFFFGSPPLFLSFVPAVACIVSAKQRATGNERLLIYG